MANYNSSYTGVEIDAAITKAHEHSNKTTLDSVEEAYTTVEKNKLDGIDEGATDDQTGSEIKSLYEAEANTNAYTDSEKTKLLGIAEGAEVNNISDANATDLTDGNDTTLHYHASDRDTDNHTSGTTNKVYTATEQTKLAGIAEGAEVNVVDSNVSGVTGADQITNIMSLTQSEYDAIGTPDNSTLYVITS